MIKKLYEKNYLNYKDLILDNTKALGLNPNCCLVLIKILDLYPTNKSISVCKILDSLAMSQNEIEECLSTLMERKFYELYISYDKGIGQEYISLDPLFKKLEDIINQKNDDTKDYNNDIYQANKLLNEEFNRNLTPSELQVLASLITDEHYSLDDIKQVTSDLKINKKNLNLRSLSTGLNNLRKTKPKVKEEQQSTNKIFDDFFSRIK